MTHTLGCALVLIVHYKDFFQQPAAFPEKVDSFSSLALGKYVEGESWGGLIESAKGNEREAILVRLDDA